MILKAPPALGRRPVGQATVHTGSIVTQTDSMTIHLDTAYRAEHFSFLVNALRMKRDILLSWAT